MGDFITLSIDLGSTIGYAVGKSGVIVESGEVTLSAQQTHPGHRFLKFQQWLGKFIDSNCRPMIDEILFEDVPRFESAAAAKVYGGLLATLSIFSLAHRIRMRSLKANQVKKDFTGHGNAKKEVMCEVAHRLGWKRGTPGTMNNHNECDAIALLWVIYARGGIEPIFINQPQRSNSHGDYRPEAEC